jgi:hypothetical protein
MPSGLPGRDSSDPETMETGDRMALAQVYATAAVAGQLAELAAEVNLARGELANIRAVLENRSP